MYFLDYTWKYMACWLPILVNQKSGKSCFTEFPEGHNLFNTPGKCCKTPSRRISIKPWHPLQ